jgi:hypothetical protein
MPEDVVMEKRFEADGIRTLTCLLLRWRPAGNRQKFVYNALWAQTNMQLQVAVITAEGDCYAAIVQPRADRASRSPTDPEDIEDARARSNNP